MQKTPDNDFSDFFNGLDVEPLCIEPLCIYVLKPNVADDVVARIKLPHGAAGNVDSFIASKKYRNQYSGHYNVFQQSTGHKDTVTKINLDDADEDTYEKAVCLIDEIQSLINGYGDGENSQDYRDTLRSAIDKTVDLQATLLEFLKETQQSYANNC